MCDESVAGGKLHHAATADPPAHASRDLPGLEQLLARQTLGLTDGTAHPGKERLPGEPAEVPVGQPGAAPGVEAHDGVSKPSQPSPSFRFFARSAVPSQAAQGHANRHADGDVLHCHADAEADGYSHSHAGTHALPRLVVFTRGHQSSPLVCFVTVP